jgi:O-antigen ligase
MALWAAIVAAQYISGHTAYRYATFHEGMNFAAYGMLTFLAVQCFRHERMLKRMGIGFAVFGAMLACFAMIQEATSQGKLYWLRTPQHGGSIYGPYVNHNHYAGLMEMLVPVSLALCLSTAVGRSTRMLTGFCALLMSASLVLSGSRGGIVAFLAELLFLAVISGISTRKSRQRAWRNLLCFCWVCLVLLLCLNSGPGWSRISDLGHAYNDEVAGGRWTIARDSLRMWAQRPLLGWGLGAFPSVFPQFRSFSSDRITNYAHNDVLQIGVEAGVAGFAVMLTFCILLYRQGLRHLSLHTSVSSAIRLGALAGCTGLIVHSFADFNLHVPANAALFYFLCGIAARGRCLLTSPESRL